MNGKKETEKQLQKTRTCVSNSFICSCFLLLDRLADSRFESILSNYHIANQDNLKKKFMNRLCFGISIYIYISTLRFRMIIRRYLLARLTSVGSPLSASPSRSSSSESSRDEILVACLAGTSSFFWMLVEGTDLTDEAPGEVCATTEPKIVKTTPIIYNPKNILSMSVKLMEWKVCRESNECTSNVEWQHDDSHINSYLRTRNA